MNIKITDLRIQQIIHNISEDFRFSSKPEKYAQLFYAVEGIYVLDKNGYSGMLEYIITAKKKIKEEILWKQNFLSEHLEIKERKLLETMKIIEKEYEELFDYLTTTSYHTF